jgi:hypothetical protein
MFSGNEQIGHLKFYIFSKYTIEGMQVGIPKTYSNN